MKWLGALAIFIVGWVIGKQLNAFTYNRLNRFELQPPVKKLLARVAQLLVVALTLMVALETAGVQMTPLIASLGVAGVGIGLATQGVLSNMVAGLLILFTKPFVVGDYIEVVGTQGEVIDIKLGATILMHGDKSHVLVPNRKIVGEIVHNYGQMRQGVVTVSVGANADLPAVLGMLKDLALANPRVMRDPGPGTGIAGLSETGVNINIVFWAKLSDVGAAGSELYQSSLLLLRSKRVPMPTREVYLRNPATTGDSVTVAN
jgi:small conductance mechanosensitive channel